MTKPPIAIVHIERKLWHITQPCRTADEAIKTYRRVSDRPAYIEWLDTHNGRTITTEITR